MSRCNFKLVGPKNGQFLFRCPDCRREVTGKHEHQPPKAACKVVGPGSLPPPIAPIPPGGPGSELKKLFAEFGFKPRKSCGCSDWIRRMDAWGIAGCREHREEILAHLRAAYDATSFWEKTKAAAVAWLNGLPLSLEGCVDEAVLRAKAEAEKAIADADEYLGANNG